MMKKLLLLWTAVMLLLCACDEGETSVEEMTNEDQGLNVYLWNRAKDGLVAVPVEVEAATTEEKVDAVLMNLKQGNGDFKPVITVQGLVERYEIRGSGIIMYMSDAFGVMDDVSLLVCRSSIVKSLTSIDGIDYVEFYLDDLPMKDSTGKRYGAFYEDDIVTENADTTDEVIAKMVTLYYPDAGSARLITVKKTIQLKSSEQLEERVIEELLVVPDNVDAVSPLPEGTVVNEVHVKDGICYVDFNEEIQLNHNGDSIGEKMTVYSIVNTLTELPEISRVQFLIEGEKTEFFKGHLDFSQLFEYNIGVVSTD